MYPFERLTDAAKETLSLGQQEAERSHHSYMGTEHLALALVTQSGTVAGEALARLGVTYEELRDRIDRILGVNERILVQPIIPTSRVKVVIEHSFHEARRMGCNYVGTEHLLLGLLIEGEGIAAHVLFESGLTLDAVRSAATELRESGIVESSTPGQPRVAAPDRAAARVVDRRVSAVVAGARSQAAQDVDDDIHDIHILRHVLAQRDRMVLGALRRLGVDPAELRAALLPPERLVELRRALRDVVAEKRSAVEREDYAAASAAKARELDLRREVSEAQADWERSLDDDSSPYGQPDSP